MCKSIELYAEEYANEYANEKDLMHVKNLMDTLNLPMEKAIDALKLTVDERNYVLKNFQK